MTHRVISTSALRAILIPCISAIVAGTGACDDASRGGPRRARPDQIPEQVAIDRGTTTYGFFTSRDRKPIDVSAFRLTKHPITVGQYKQCVDAGACSVPMENVCLADGPRHALRGPTYDLDSADALPVTCVGIPQAQAYCSWVGGVLPNIIQWITAARGRDVARFAWGNALPGCDQRPDVTPSRGAARCNKSLDPSFGVGGHLAAASPFGVEDVLLAPGELIATSVDSPVSTCAAPFAACVAYGVRPGAIDSVAPLDSVGTDHGEQSPHAYAFRCAFPGESK